VGWLQSVLSLGAFGRLMDAVALVLVGGGLLCAAVMRTEPRRSRAGVAAAAAGAAAWALWRWHVWRIHESLEAGGVGLLETRALAVPLVGALVSGLLLGRLARHWLLGRP
jgi:hypothetical protein